MCKKKRHKSTDQVGLQAAGAVKAAERPQRARRVHLLRGLDLDQVDRLAELGLRGQLARVEHAAAGRDDLAPAAVDRVRVHHHVAHLRACDRAGRCISKGKPSCEPLTVACMPLLCWTGSLRGAAGTLGSGAAWAVRMMRREGDGAQKDARKTRAALPGMRDAERARPCIKSDCTRQPSREEAVPSAGRRRAGARQAAA